MGLLDFLKPPDDGVDRGQWSDVPIGMRLGVLGNQLMAISQGRPVDPSGLGIMAATTQQAVEGRAKQKAKEKALVYARKVGDPNLIAAIENDLIDPAELIKMQYDKASDAEKRKLDMEDFRTKTEAETAQYETKRRMDNEYAQRQAKWALENDPNAKLFRDWFTPGAAAPAPGGTPGSPVPSAVQPVATPAVPNPGPGPGPVPGAVMAAPVVPMPTPQTTEPVSPFLAPARELTGIPDLTPAEAFEVAMAVQQGKLVEAKDNIMKRRFEQQKANRPDVVAPGSSLVDKDGNVIKTIPQNQPADVVMTERMMKDPQFKEAVLERERAKQPAASPPDADLRKKLLEKTGESWSVWANEGNAAQARLTDISILENLLSVAPQGINMDAYISSVVPGYSNSADTVKSLVKRLAPQQRAEGSGSTSDIEYQGFLDSLPKLINDPAANKAIASVFREKAKLDVERSAVANQYARGEVDFVTASKKMDELNSRSIIPDEVKALIAPIAEEGATSTPLSSTAKAAGLTQEDWNNLTDEERASIGD
jgi:hypothetical protein